MKVVMWNIDGVNGKGRALRALVLTVKPDVVEPFKLKPLAL